MMSGSSLWSRGPISALDRSSNLPSICFITLFNQDLIFWKSLELRNSPIDVHHNSQSRLGLYLGGCPKLNWILRTADRLKTWSVLFLAAWSGPENGRLYWVSFIHREFEACLAQQATIRPSSTRRRKAVFSGTTVKQVHCGTDRTLLHKRRFLSNYTPRTIFVAPCCSGEL